IPRISNPRDAGGSKAPKESASTVFVTPAVSPLIAASTRASLADILRVRLLSSAQHKHAATMADSADKLPADEKRAGQTRTRPPTKMAASPITTRAPAGSLKTTHAKAAVNTTSRFNSREAEAASTCASPVIRRAGATTPPTSVDNANQTQSRPPRPVADQPRSCT